MEPGLIWILAGLALLAAELALPGIFLLWVGLAAIGAGLVEALAAPPLWQTVLVFLLLLAGGVDVAMGLRRRSPREKPLLNTPDAGLVGRQGVMLPPEGPQQRVRIGDSDWPARLTRHAEASPGTPVRVEAVDGTTLVVRPLT